MLPTSSVRRARARLAGTVKHHPDADVTHLRRELKAAKLEQAIRAAVDAAPPLTDDQRSRLAGLLAPRGQQ